MLFLNIGLDDFSRKSLAAPIFTMFLLCIYLLCIYLFTMYLLMYVFTMFSSKSLVVSGCRFRSFIHLDLAFVYDER